MLSPVFDPGIAGMAATATTRFSLLRPRSAEFAGHRQASSDPVRLGDLMPELAARYGLDQETGAGVVSLPLQFEFAAAGWVPA